MRLAIITATAVVTAGIAAALTVSPADAQTRRQVVVMSINECIDLARKRGYTESDLGAGGAKSNPARRFVIACLQGRQR